MSKFKITLALATVAVLAACRGDGGTAILASHGPVAYVRFVNAIPDSGAQDWRFVDLIEESPNTLNMPFRGIFPGASYQAASSGSRHLRVFQSSFDQGFNDPNQASPSIVSTVFLDSTFTLTEGQHYTIMAVGNLRAPRTAKFVILNDSYSDPGTSVAVRSVNAGAAASIDVYGSATGGMSALPPTPLVAGLAQYAASTWITTAPAALAVRANASGSTTLPAMIDVTAPAGVPADRSLNLTAIGGSTIAGSAFTVFLFPAAVQNSRAALVVAGTCPTKCATAGAVFAVDKYPPSGF
jgi:hypothetical protein